ncbi:MAG TPA: hydroxyacid dehydrogenase [Burkholderiales bacterium]|nr:hydroxyacid dehydrogenase [Burkholderiales bacterium]
MKIFILDSFHPAGLEYAAKHAEIVRWDDPRVKNWPEEADAVMVRGTKIRAEDLARAKKVKIISKQGVGYDNIDVAAAKKHGIPVVRTPGVNREAVAELALGLAIAVGRRIAELDRRVRSHETLDRTKILGVEMWGKTVGIVGVGNIGVRVAHKWRAAFDCKIIGYDPHKKLEIPQAENLAELLKKADLVTLHVPLNEETKYLIGKRELALMKPTAILINTCRGGVIDEAALYEALKAGRLFGAGIDVWETETPRIDSRLLELSNVVATPHAGGGTEETQIRSALQVAEQAVDALNGKPLTAENRIA